MKQSIYNLIILDASGSMYSIRNEAIAGVVETVQTIRTAQEENKEQEQLLSLVVFNGKKIATVFDRMPITKVPDLNEKDYQPTDNTPLYDAMGDSITNLRRYLDEDDDVLVTVKLALYLYRRQPGRAGCSQRHGYRPQYEFPFRCQRNQGDVLERTTLPKGLLR